MKILLPLISLILSTSLYALNSGDKIKCYDDVSNHTYFIKIVDIGDESAYIRVKTSEGDYFYPSARVIFDETMSGASFKMLSKDSTTILEELFLSNDVLGDGNIQGYYADRGDSRAVECMIY